MDILQPLIARTGLIVKGILRVIGTGAIRFPMGTTAERPAMEDGLYRFNTTLNKWEKSISGVWTQDMDSADVAALVTSLAAEWVSSGLVATYVSTTSFTVPGDQTALLPIGRRIRTANTGGTRYSRITNSVFASTTTTVTVVNDSGTLDSGITSLSYAFLSSVNPSLPNSAAVRTAMGVAASGANADITSLAAGVVLTNPENTEQVLTDAATTAWNMNNGHIAKWTITATGRTLGAPTNYKTGGQYQLLVKLNTPATMTPAFNAIFKFPYDVLPDFTTSSYTLLTMTWSTEHTKFLVTYSPGF